jgi:hypothetical protein
MPDRVEHCPFLNRSDARCADNFNIDHLQHAFKFCFGRYKSCPSYTELLVERTVRRSEAAAGRRASVTTSSETHGKDRFVQLTVSAGHAQHAAGAA